MQESTDQSSENIEDQSEEDQLLHAGTESTLTRQNESMTINAEAQHKEQQLIIADDSQRQKKSLSLYLYDSYLCPGPNPFNIYSSICAQSGSASESLVAQRVIVRERARRDGRQRFMELRRRVEKAWEPYHRQSRALEVNCCKEKQPQSWPNTSDSQSQSEPNYRPSLVVLGNLQHTIVMNYDVAGPNGKLYQRCNRG